MDQFDSMNEQEQMQTMMSQLQDANLRQSVMQYLNQTANGLDKNANSKVLIETLARESMHNQKNTILWKSRTNKSAAVGVMAVVLAISVQFVVNYFTNELSKESHVDHHGALVSTNGQTVQTQMEEMKVSTDGRLVSRDGKSNVKTMPTLARVTLVSSLPDSTLMGLDEIVVHSDKGHTLQIKVQGFSRVPVLNSRCGNVVHFYTAWKGKITLDSTDLSFDDATAAEFENAGFGFAMGGRRLAEGNTMDGFFKALETVRASGKWTCADVPLPSLPRTYVFSTNEYSPCKQGECESRFGSYLPGTERATRDFVAIATRNARASGGVVPGMYFKTQKTQMVSDRYQMSTETMMLHPGQRFVRIFDTHKHLSQEFQLSANGTKSRCVSQLEKTKKIKADSDMHFEYVGMEEETGSMLRHFRMTRSHEFLVEMAGDDVKTGVTEFWDDAQTLQPRRLVELDGTVTMFASTKASLSDADIEKQFGVWLDDCTEQNNKEMGIPTMSKLVDLNEEEIEYYKEQEFRQSEELWKSAAANNDAFAIYLLKANDPLSVSDRCKAKCQTVINAAMTQMQVQSLTCENGSILETAMECMKPVQECVQSNFYVDHQYDCWDSENKTKERQLETEEEEEETEEEEAETEQQGGSQLLLSNHTEATGAASRQMFDWGPECLSSYFIPAPLFKKKAVHWSHTHDRYGSPIPEHRRTTYTLPWCMQLVLDNKYKPAGAFWNSWADGVHDWIWNEAVEKNKKALGEASFTFRFVWTFFYDPYMGPWDGFLRKIHGKWEITNKIKWAVDLMIRACVPVQYLFGFAIPGFPLFCKLCGAVNIVVTTKRPCPGQAGVAVSGKGAVSFSIGLDLLFLWVEIGLVELGVAAGQEYVLISTGWCWMVKASEAPNRRRYWDRRRAPTRRCNNGAKECDIYIKGWLRLKIAVAQVTLRFVWYSKTKRIEWWLKIEVKRFWLIWVMDWHAYYDNCFWVHRW